MNTASYVIWTESGYYYTVGQGRYGRVTGQKSLADVLCRTHADGVLAILAPHGVKARTEEVASRGCMTCRRKGAA